jgi:predicted RNA-binding protein with RPS1 domain
MEEVIHSEKGDVKKKIPQGKEMDVEIVAIDEKGRIQLSQKIMKDKEDREEFQKFLKKEEKPGKLGTLGEIFTKLKK